MMVPAALEVGLATVLRGREIGAKTMIRPWRRLRWDPLWGRIKSDTDSETDSDYYVPCISIVANPFAVDEQNGMTFCEIAADIMVAAEDDPDHSRTAAIEAEVCAVWLELYRGMCAGDGVAAEFVAAAREVEPRLRVAAWTPSDPMGPATSGQLHTITFLARVDFRIEEETEGDNNE